MSVLSTAIRNQGVLRMPSSVPAKSKEAICGDGVEETKELKKRYWGMPRERIVLSDLEAVRSWRS
jgi:hypothetical protein